jgi:diguanylate cyclase (GGDEF)-like protein
MQLAAPLALAATALPMAAFAGWWSLVLLVGAGLCAWVAGQFVRRLARRRNGLVFVAGVSGFGVVALGLVAGTAGLTGLPPLSGLWHTLGLLLCQAGLVGIVLSFALLEERHFLAQSQTAIMACEELQYVLGHDPLTGLRNRDAFHRYLESTLACHGGDGGQLALLYLDLDHFRDINDSLNSVSGDELLREVAERLTMIVSDEERVFRTGEDEFAVVVNCQATRSGATEVAEEILAMFNRRFVASGSEVFLTGSIGIAFADCSGEGGLVLTSDLCQQADNALRHAKLDRNTYRFHTPDLGDHALSKLQYFNYLRQAIDRHELNLHFQPQVNRQGTVISAEALLRWNNPVLGSVPPSEFIPIAEEAGLIIPIGDWVIDRACAELVHWRSIGLDIPLAINISPRQLKDGRLEQTLLGRLRKYGLRPDCLHLEITESSLIEDTARTMQVLENLHRAGFAMSIDDFGTGYANLSWLKRLPVGVLKIDRSFVVDMPNNAQDLAMVQAIVNIAKCRGMTTIAEGADSQSQIDLLHAADCDIIQGFYYSRPLPSADFIGYALAQAG